MKKITLWLLVMLMAFTLIGCDEWNGLWDNKDEETAVEISNIDTKEEAVTFLINKIKTWKYATAEVTALSLFSFPIEAYFDFSNKKGYAREYSENNNETISRSYYMENTTVYTYDSTGDPVYDCFDVKTENPDIDFDKYLTVLDDETVNLDLFDLEDVIFTKDENSMTLSFSFNWQNENYDIQIVYKRLSIRVVIDDLATVTFEPSETNFFDTFTFDFTPYLQ